MFQGKKLIADESELYTVVRKLVDNEMTLDGYLIDYCVSLEDLVRYAKESGKFKGSEIRKLVELKLISKDFEKEFDLQEYEEVYSILVNGKPVKASEDQIAACIAFIRQNGLYECDYQVRFVISCYLRNLIDVKGNDAKQELLKYKQELSHLRAKKMAKKKKKKYYKAFIKKY